MRRPAQRSWSEPRAALRGSAGARDRPAQARLQVASPQNERLPIGSARRSWPERWQQRRRWWGTCSNKCDAAHGRQLLISSDSTARRAAGIARSTAEI
eukprot:7383811-Prymnesium_polylepis.4